MRVVLKLLGYLAIAFVANVIRRWCVDSMHTIVRVDANLVGDVLSLKASF